MLFNYVIFFRFPICVIHGIFVITLMSGANGIIIRVTCLIVLYKGSWALLPVASLNQRKLIVVLQYCLAPTTVAVVFLFRSRVSLLRPFGLHIIHTCFSHQASIFFFFHSHYTPRAIAASSHCFTYKFFPLILVPFITHPICVTIWPYNSQQNSIVLHLTCIILLLMFVR